MGLVLMGRTMLSKSLIQLAVDEQSSVASLLLGLRPSLVEVIKTMATSFKSLMRALLLSVPLTHAPAGDSWTLAVKSGSASCGLTAPFSWVLVRTTFCLCPCRVCLPSPVEVL